MSCSLKWWLQKKQKPSIAALKREKSTWAVRLWPISCQHILHCFENLVFPSFFIFIYILNHCLLFKCSLPLVSLSWCDVESAKLVNSHWGQFHPASGKWQRRSSRRIMWQSSFHALWLQYMWGLNNCREIRGPSHLRSPLFIHTTHECICFYSTSHQVGEDPCIMVSALK